MATDRAWLAGIRAAAEATKNITVAVVTGRKEQVAAEVHLETLVLQLRAVTRPEDWDGVLDEVYRRAARMTAEEALESTRRDVAMGWRPGPVVSPGEQP